MMEKQAIIPQLINWETVIKTIAHENKESSITLHFALLGLAAMITECRNELNHELGLVKEAKDECPLCGTYSERKAQT